MVTYGVKRDQGKEGSGMKIAFVETVLIIDSFSDFTNIII
jgi:hypothetical protein